MRKTIQELFQSEHSSFIELIVNLENHLENLGPDLLAGWLYGSVAKSTDGPGSDIDIAIVTRKSARARLKDQLLEGLRVLGELLAINPSLVALDTDDVLRLAEGDPFWTELVNYAIPLKGDRPEEFIAGLNRARKRQPVKA